MLEYNNEIKHFGFCDICFYFRYERVIAELTLGDQDCPLDTKNTVGGSCVAAGADEGGSTSAEAGGWIVGGA